MCLLSVAAHDSDCADSMGPRRGTLLAESFGWPQTEPAKLHYLLPVIPGENATAWLIGIDSVNE